METMRIRTALPIALLLVLCLAATAAAQGSPIKVQLKTTEPRTVALIKSKGPYTGIPAMIDRLYAELEKGGYVICGPLMTVFFNDPSKTPPEELLWDVRIPVTNPGDMRSADEGKLGFGYQGPAYVAYTYHVGPYETIAEAYNTLFDWARTNRYDVTGFVTETRWSAPDAKNVVTEVWLPVNEKTPAERAFR
jgi:effector-binding domain-containing protein